MKIPDEAQSFKAIGVKFLHPFQGERSSAAQALFPGKPLILPGLEAYAAFERSP